MKLLLLFIFSIILFNSNILYSQNRIYVHPNLGNDNGNNGRNIQFPLKTIQAAGFICHGGDTIFIRGGHYTAFHDMFWQTDTLGLAPVWIMPYFNETVTLDGAGYTFPEYVAVLSIEHARNVIVLNLSVMNNNTNGFTYGGPGIRAVSNDSPLFITKNIVIKNCIVSDVYRQGILVQASNVTVDNCEVYNAVLRNKNGPLQGGWDCSVGTVLWPPEIKSWDNVVFKNNRIHNSWGEGILALRCYNFLIENNHIYNVYSCNIYADNSRKGLIRNNWVQSTNDSFNMRPPYFYAPASGIMWATELNNYGVDSLVSDLDIYNNLIIRTNAPIGWWRDTNNPFFNNSYKNINVYYNTIYNTYGYEAFYLDANTTGIYTPTNCNFKNNIICKGQYPLGTYQQYFTLSSHYQNWQIDYNCFIYGNIPSVVTLPHNITGSPSFVDSTNINIDTNFKVKASSNCRFKAIPLTGFTKDYWNAFRDNALPCIGIHEYGGLSTIENLGNTFPTNNYLNQNYPNPFNPVTNIKFGIQKKGLVSLIIYDIFGRELTREIDHELRNPGEYSIAFNSKNYSSGIYFYKLIVNNLATSKKMVLVK